MARLVPLLLIVGLTAVGCRRTRDVAPVTPEVKGKAGAPPDPCIGLDLGTCLATPGCVVDEVTPTKCRPAEGPCENAVLQLDLNPPPAAQWRASDDRFKHARSACVQVRGCEVVPGRCFCPCNLEGFPDCRCVCGGGPPAACRRRNPGEGAPGMRRVEDVAAPGAVIVPPASEADWAPRVSDVVAFETGLPGYLRKARPSGAPDLGRKLGSYYRQYQGKIENGRRVLVVWLSCVEPPGFGLRLSVVKDGGACQVQVRFDPEQAMYLGVAVNGDG